MDLTLTDDQELVATTAREFLESRSTGADARAMEADPVGYSTEVWKEMVDLGWIGLALPPEHDGGGGTFVDLCLLVEQMGAFQVPSPFLSTAVQGALTVDRFGTDQQRADWLAPIANGQKILACALPASGSPRAATAGEAAITAKAAGDGVTLSGAARFVPFAAAAHDLVVVAPGEEPGAVTVAIVATDAAGVAVSPLDAVGHDRPAAVTFDSVDVTADRIVGGVERVGDGAEIADWLVAIGATATCAEMVGGAQRVLDLTVDYASEREQFGRPIGSFQAVQHHCANMAIDVMSSRFITYEAAWRLAEGLDAAQEVSMAKAWVSEAYQRVCALGHQVHGAIGFTREHDLHLFFRHCVASELSFGDSDVHWDRIANGLGL